MNSIKVVFTNLGKFNWTRTKFDILYGGVSVIKGKNSFINVGQLPSKTLGARGAGGAQTIAFDSTLGSALSEPAETYIEWTNESSGESLEIVVVAKVQIGGIGPRPYWMVYKNGHKDSTEYEADSITFDLGHTAIAAKGDSSHASLSLTVGLQDIIGGG